MLVAGIVRDISIILVAIESMIIMALMGILIWQLWRLTRMLQNELRPMIKDTQDTLGTVRGTSNFMSEHLVAPVMEANSRVTGLRRTLQVLAGNTPVERTQEPTTTGATTPPQNRSPNGATTPSGQDSPSP